MIPTCPQCRISPLRFIRSGDCSDSTGGGTYRCVCGFTSARDRLVERLLREKLETDRLLTEFALLAIPRLLRHSTCTCRGETDPALEPIRWLGETLGLPRDHTDSDSLPGGKPERR